mgnify:CR=1 FL=1
MHRAFISGIGHYLPKRIVTNDELSKVMDTSNEWIMERTGIEQRHYVEAGQGPSDLAIPATEKALEKAVKKMNKATYSAFLTESFSSEIPFD